MRTFTLALVFAATSLLAAEVFRSYRQSWTRPPFSGTEEQFSLITNNITLGRIVAILGPGWISPDDDTGVIRWPFRNGRLLNVSPSRYEPDEVISTNRDAKARMWVSRTRNEIIAN